MPTVSARAISALDLVEAAFSSPLVSLMLALIITAGIVFIGSPSGGKVAPLSGAHARSVHARYAPEHRALGAVAIGIVVAFIAELVFRGYVSTSTTAESSWARFTVALACAAIGVGVVLWLIITRGTTPPQVAVVPSVRRNWASFSSWPALLIAGVAFLALVATTVAAGIASSPNDEGQYAWLAIPIPNEPGIDPIRMPFYGWFYGVPVLVCLVVLVVVVWAALHRNAARPFLRPETVAAERLARRETARNTVVIATASTLLSLAGVWRLIARAGSGASLIVTGQNGDAPYDAAWRFAELAVAAGWCAPLLEVIAFTLLLLIAAASLRHTRATRSSSAPAKVTARAKATR